MCIWSHTHGPDRHWIPCPKLVSGMSEILNFWDLKSRVLRCQKSYFLDMSAKVRKSWNLAKSWKITKIAKIAKISKIPKNRTFWRSKGYHTWPAKIALRTQKSRNRDFSGKVRISENSVPDTKFQVSAGAKKSAKISSFRDLKKIEKLCCMPWERRVANGGIFRSAEVKKTHFFGLFRG